MRKLQNYKITTLVKFFADLTSHVTWETKIEEKWNLQRNSRKSQVRSKCYSVKNE